MQQIAVSWLVYRMTDSAFLLGMVSFATNLPIFLMAPLGGILADRVNRHRLLVIVQTLSMLQALVFGLLVLGNWITVWQVMVLGVMLGIINAFDMPIRQSFVVEMIEDRDDLSNAIALNSSIFNVARLLGPSIAGILIAAVGEGWCLLLNGLSYIPVIIALMAMKPVPQIIDKRPGRIVEGLKEGFRYSFGFVPIRSLLLLLALVSIIGIPYSVLMPVFARDILHGGSDAFGFLVGASGIGALIGAIYLASRRSVRGLIRIVAIAAVTFGVGLIFLSLSRVMWLSLCIMVVTGFGMIVQMAASNTVLQTIVEDDKRGRVMSLYTLSIRGMAPFGGLLAGGLAATLGAPNTILIGGLCCILGGLLFARNLGTMRALMRPIYQQKGIVPVSGTSDFPSGTGRMSGNE